MANYNYSTAVYMANKYGIQDVQLVQGKNPRQCTSIIYKGNKVSTSSMTKAELDTLFNHIACHGNIDGFVKSVARQKINNAWGYNMASMLANYEKQVRTYGDSFKTMIKLKDRNLADVMIEYIQDGELDNMLSVENWKKSVINFYTESEYDIDGTLTYKVDYEKGLIKKFIGIFFKKIKVQNSKSSSI